MFVPDIQRVAFAVAAGAIMLAGPAFAETVKYTADLTADAEVPPTDSSATGTADVTVDTDAKNGFWCKVVRCAHEALRWVAWARCLAWGLSELR